MTRLFAMFAAPLLVLLEACGGAPPDTQRDRADDMHDYDPCAGETGASVDCSAWMQWTKINTQRFESGGHKAAWVDIYTEPQHADAYRSLSGPMPVGFRVVKAQYETPDAAEPSGLTVMGKMEPGYDPDHGDWFYGVYDATGTKAIKQGKLGMCLECHEADADQDYLSGIPEAYR